MLIPDSDYNHLLGGHNLPNFKFMKKLLILLVILTACHKAPVKTEPTPEPTPIVKTKHVLTYSTTVAYPGSLSATVTLNSKGFVPPIDVWTGDTLKFKAAVIPPTKQMDVAIYLDNVQCAGKQACTSFETTIIIP